MSNNLWSWSATAIAEAIAKREISAREAVSSCLDRLEAVNPALNAVIEVLADEGLAAADAADRRTLRGGSLPPLHGVPVTAKVNVDLRGKPTTSGIVAFKNHVATEDSSAVSLLRNAGAVVFGQTNCQAFSLRWFTDNDLYGPTLNPWNPGLTPGGSSGGAAAAVAAGIGPLAHGNDVAGSVRYPAYACGVAGFRPSVGRIATFNPSTAAFGRGISLQLTNVEGLLARHVADLRRALPALAARDARDPSWIPIPLELPKPACPRQVALCDETDTYPVDPAVAAALRRAAEMLSDAGYIVERLVMPREAELTQMWLDLLINDSQAHLAPLVQQLGDATSRIAMTRFTQMMRPMDVAAYSALLGRREQIHREWTELFDRHPIVLMPSSWARPFRVGEDLGDVVRYREIVAAQGPMLGPAVLGLPALSVPMGEIDGVPLGVQVVANRFYDTLCLDGAEAIEMQAGVLTPIDPRPGFSTEAL